MADITGTVDREAISKRAMEILNQRYQDCAEGHKSPVVEKCIHCYRHLHYESDNDIRIERDFSAGLIKITLELDDGRLH